MTKKGRGNKGRRFESTGVLVGGRSRVKRRPAASRVLSLRLRGVLLLLMGAAMVGAMWLTIDERFYVDHVDVVGTVRVSPDKIFQASGVLGLHILWTRSAAIEERILDALPAIESVQAKCRLPADCAIVVVERQPRMVWDENGLLWWIDADGIIFHAQGALAEGWTIRGPLPRDEDGRLDRRVRVALTELWATGEDVASVFDYVPARGLVFTDEQGWRIVLGQGPGMAKRLQVLERMMADLEARGMTPRFVDVRFADAPYYSLTNDW
ncbi:MAG: FtsQ-type POTRA domain-containing protein [Anaerolineae bacterium]